MSTRLDFSPIYRSSIGFDRVFSRLANTSLPQSGSNWPPYDILKLGEDSYRIVLALAGFSEDELSITHEPNILVINGVKSDTEEVHYLHHGLALRSFVRRFELADHVDVVGATLENGLLEIDLKKEVPEEMKPRQIAINADADLDAASRPMASNLAA